MDLPPAIIRVKRKADDESPVTILQYESASKRPRSDSRSPSPSLPRTSSQFVFVRRDAADKLRSSLQPPPSATATVNHSSRLGGPTYLPPGPGAASEVAGDVSSSHEAANLADLGTPRRRFHMSRAAMNSAANMAGDHRVSKKARHSTAIFMERKTSTELAIEIEKVLKTQQDAEAKHKGKDSSVQSGKTRELKATAEAISDSQAAESKMKKEQESRPIRRRPGPASRTGSKQPLPPSMVNPFEEPAKLSAQMDAWTLSVIGQGLREIEEESKKQEQAKTNLAARKAELAQQQQQQELPKLRAAPMRFKPNSHVRRLKDRSPERWRQLEAKELAEEAARKAQAEEGNDKTGDWIVDEFVRIPVHELSGAIDPATVGVIVIADAEESELFFGPEKDPDDEMDEDSDDSNAENYYTNDYPDEDVEWDDENDKGSQIPYQDHHDGYDQQEGFVWNDSDDDRVDPDNDDGYADELERRVMRRFHRWQEHNRST